MLARLTMTMAALLIAAAVPARAEFVNENLLLAPPPGFKVGHRAKNNAQMITELIPSGETIDSWTEMVTVQIFYNSKSTPEQFRARMDKLWSSACPGARPSSVIDEGVENGYPVQLFLLACEKNPKTGKPEITWLKAVQGRDSFYVVQKATRFMPPKDSVTPLMAFFRKVGVCDSRLADRKCPATRS